MHCPYISVLAFAAAGFTPVMASLDKTFCCSKSPSVAKPVTAHAPEKPAAPVRPVTVSVGYEPTAHTGVFVRSIPAPPASPASAAGQVLMLPGGTWPALPSSAEADVPPVPFVTPEGVTIVKAPSWLRAYATITLGADGKPKFECAQPSGPPVAAVPPSDSGKKEPAR